MDKIKLDKIFKKLKLHKLEIPVLKNYVIKGNKITATNLDISISVDVDMLGDYVMGLDFQPSSLATIDEIPTMKFIAKQYNSFKVSIKELKLMSKFSSKEESRYYLNGVNIDATEQRLVATDGLVLGMLGKKIANKENDFKAIISNDTIENIINVATQLKQKEVEILTTDKMCKAIMDGCIIIANNIEGKFPDYERAIPKNNSIDFSLSVDDVKKCFNKYRLDKIGSELKHVPIEINDGMILSLNVFKRLQAVSKHYKQELKCSREISNLSPVIFKTDGFEGIAMPLRL